MKKLIDTLNRNHFLSNLTVLLLAVAFYLIAGHLDVIGSGVSTLLSVLSPVVLGGVIAYLMNPASHFFADKLLYRMKNRKAAFRIGVGIAFLVALALLMLLMAAIVPQLISSVVTLINQMPSYLNSLQKTVTELDAQIDFVNIDVEKIIGSGTDWFNRFSSWALTNLNGIVNASAKIGSSVVNFALAVVVAIYILMDKATVKRMLHRMQAAWMKPHAAQRVNIVLEKSNQVFFSFVGGSLLDALVIGTANFIFMTLLGMPYAMLITVVVALTNLIPVFGPFVGAVIGGLILLVVNPLMALWFLLFTAVLQALDSNLIKTFLFGNTTGLRPLWVLIAVLVGGRLFGVWGMLLGIPVAAVVTWLLGEMLDAKLAKNGCDENGNKTPEQLPSTNLEE